MAQTYNLDQIKYYSQNAGGLTDANAANNIVGMLGTMKQAVQQGQMSLTDFQNYSQPLIKQAGKIVRTISSQGSKQADSVKGASEALNGTYYSINNSDGSFNFLSPFSKQEYANLPNGVLPTQDDVNSGKFDTTGAPLSRVQTPAGGTATPTGNPTAPQPGQPGQPSAPQPAFTPTNSANQAPDTVTAGNNPNTNVAPSTVNSQVEGAPIYSASPNNPGPNGGLVINGTQASQDASQIANEAALQQQLSTQSQQGVTAARAKYLQDLTGVLNQNTANQLNDQAPGIYEDLNSHGLLRSSALGNSMATAAKSLQANTTNQLAQQAIAGETADLGNDTTIQNTYNQGRNSALQRQFSVEDYNNQIAAGKAMGEQYANLRPQTPSTKDQAAVAAAPSLAPAAAQAVTKTSDITLKQDVVRGDEAAYEFLNTLEPILYSYKDEKHGRGVFLGISAQDMEQSRIGRSIVETTNDGKQLDSWKLISALVGCIAHLNGRIQLLEREV